MNKKIALVLVALVFLAASCNRSQPIATIGDHVVNIEIADTQSKRNQGLSGRESLAENLGMLFVFENEGKHTFWMKDMKFALDFIWIRDGKVVEITSDVPVLPLETYEPVELIDSMLEVNSGFASKNTIKVGDSVRVDFNSGTR